MDKLSVKGSDISLSLAGSKKTNNRTGGVTDDFRALLTGKQTDSQGAKDSKEITKDSQDTKDTEPGKDQVTNDTKKDAVSEEQGKPEKVEEPDKQTEGLMAAYQMSQGMRPEMIQLAPETEEAAPEIVIGADTEITVQAAGTEEMTTVAQPEQKADTANVQAQAADIGLQKDVPQQTDTDASDVRMADVKPAVQEAGASEAKQDTADLTSQFKDRSRTSQTEEKTQVQTESTMAENGAPVAAESPRIRQAEVPKYETVTTVHVEQPEELPEKVTNQLLSKLAEGVKEFEIHIEPANLGKLAIKVLYEGSQATISIVCSEKRALDVLGQNAREIGNIIERNLGEETTIIVEKQETDYLNQTRDENEQAGQEQQKQKENGKNQDNEDAGDFLQKLRLGLTG